MLSRSADTGRTFQTRVLGLFSVLEMVPARAPLPAGMPNYVTPRGLAKLKSERRALDDERARLDATASDVDRSRALSDLAARQSVLEDRNPSHCL
jgi:hypothetical protein